MKIRIVLIFLLFCAGCTSREDFKTGCMINREGHITDHSTVYTFSDLRKNRQIRQLFNDIYFKGDMLCFSLSRMDNISGNDVSVTFIHQPTGRTVGAERIEKSGSVIWGFSLVGSVLEAFFPDEPASPADTWKERDIDIPVLIRVEYSHEKARVKREKNLMIRVRY